MVVNVVLVVMNDGATEDEIDVSLVGYFAFLQGPETWIEVDSEVCLSKDQGESVSWVSVNKRRLLLLLLRFQFMDLVASYFFQRQ